MVTRKSSKPSKNKPLGLSGKVGIIGAGVMGRTLAKGMLDAGVVKPSGIWAASRKKASVDKARAALGITVTSNYKSLLKDTSVLILCVKPSGLSEVLADLKKHGLPEKCLIISILAGKTLSDIGEGLASKNPIIRAMPNTPCVVGHGMTILAGGHSCKQSHIKVAQAIFGSVGETLELEEKHFDAITGLGGSGPAYIYLMMEALADGGVRVGLPREAALNIVSQTMLGSAMMVKAGGRHPASLRDDVTTPAGCTIAGLLMMEDGKIRSVLARAVEEAAKVAGELRHSK